MTPSPSQISLANIVQTVQYRFEYYPRKSQKINSHIIQNVFHTLKIILKQYKISWEIDQTSKHQTISIQF